MDRSFRVRRLVAATLTMLIAAPALASCRTAATGAPTGHVAGVTYIRGSVTPRTGVEARVTATRTDGAGQPHSTETRSDGSFAFDLAPGTYKLTATLTKQNPGSIATPEDVAVSAGKTITIDLYVNFP